MSRTLSCISCKGEIDKEEIAKTVDTILKEKGYEPYKSKTSGLTWRGGTFFARTFFALSFRKNDIYLQSWMKIPLFGETDLASVFLEEKKIEPRETFDTINNLLTELQ